MAAHPKHPLVQAIKDTEPHLTNLWKTSANNFGWNAQDANMIKVKADEQGIRIEHHPDATQKIFDLEHGYKTETPKPALREFTESSKTHIEHAVHDALFTHIKEHL